MRATPCGVKRKSLTSRQACGQFGLYAGEIIEIDADVILVGIDGHDGDVFGFRLKFPGVDLFDDSCAGLGERGLHDRVLLIERYRPEHVHCTPNDAVEVLAKQGFGLRAERGLRRIGEALRHSCFPLGLKRAGLMRRSSPKRRPTRDGDGKLCGSVSRSRDISLYETGPS